MKDMINTLYDGFVEARCNYSYFCESQIKKLAEVIKEFKGDSPCIVIYYPRIDSRVSCQELIEKYFATHKIVLIDMIKGYPDGRVYLPRLPSNCCYRSLSFEVSSYLFTVESYQRRSRVRSPKTFQELWELNGLTIGESDL